MSYKIKDINKQQRPFISSMYLNFSLNICQNLKLCFNQKQNVTVKNILIVDSKKRLLRHA